MLDHALADYFKLTPRQLDILNRFGLKTVRDLLWHFPSRYEGFAGRRAIADLYPGERASVHARIIKIEGRKSFRKKINIVSIVVADGTGTLRITWFNQPYIAHILKQDQDYTFTGIIKSGKDGLTMSSPIYESGEVLSSDEGILVPIYPETRGLTSRWLRFAIKRILSKINNADLVDAIPEEILKKFNLPTLKKSLEEIHFPKDKKWAEASRKRFSFEEIFIIQLMRQGWRKERESHSSYKLNIDAEKIKKFIATLPFKLTGAQEKSLNSIFEDIKSNKPMSRLLEGDVGSGKTIIALIASLVAVQNGFQVAYMAPTEVLARQHFEEFIKLLGNPPTGGGIKMAMAASSEFLKYPSKAFAGKPTHIARAPLLKWLENGEIEILIGTHSLIQEKIKFKNLALVIIDEQHRFGVNQRLKLTKKNAEIIPHLLSMTATPIPRTLALTIYGDLDLTLLDEMPVGRKRVITEIIPPEGRKNAYEHIRGEIKNGRQAYVLCPRIDESEDDSDRLISLNMKAVKAEYKKLSEEIFPELKVGMLHGKMKPKEKEKIMNEFRDGKINILVATSVIEVGVNVPNATVIMIEGAERFGLSQLHQLRGRVMRSSYQPYCFLFTESYTGKTKERLKALTEAKTGFELSQFDLELRGAGELTGSKQWGVSDVAMEALRNIKMVEAAREEARRIIEKNLLSKYPELEKRIKSLEGSIHFE